MHGRGGWRAELWREPSFEEIIAAEKAKATQNENDSG